VESVLCSRCSSPLGIGPTPPGWPGHESGHWGTAAARGIDRRRGRPALDPRCAKTPQGVRLLRRGRRVRGVLGTAARDPTAICGQSIIRSPRRRLRAALLEFRGQAPSRSWPGLYRRESLNSCVPQSVSDPQAPDHGCRRLYRPVSGFLSTRFERCALVSAPFSRILCSISPIWESRCSISRVVTSGNDVIGALNDALRESETQSSGRDEI
jgi:hypothetical protein